MKLKTIISVLALVPTASRTATFGLKPFEHVVKMASVRAALTPEIERLDRQVAYGASRMDLVAFLVRAEVALAGFLFRVTELTQHRYYVRFVSLKCGIYTPY